MSPRKPAASLSLTHPDAAGTTSERLATSSPCLMTATSNPSVSSRALPPICIAWHNGSRTAASHRSPWSPRASTGSPLYELLDSQGVTVYLVNVRHVKNVSGRKSNVLDWQWLQQLMSYGLLAGAFRPPDKICVLREMSPARQVRHIQQIAQGPGADKYPVDPSPVRHRRGTGQAIICAIVNGERDPHALAHLKKRKALALYDAYQQMLNECDQHIQAELHKLQRHPGEPGESQCGRPYAA